MNREEDRREILNRINLFEVLLIAIYGSWLISLVDKISFSKAPIGFLSGSYQILCISLSLFCLLLLFVYSIFSPNEVTPRLWFLLGVGHTAGNYCAVWAEGFTRQNSAFLGIGTGIFLIIYSIERQRIRLTGRPQSRGQKSLTQWT